MKQYIKYLLLTVVVSVTLWIIIVLTIWSVYTANANIKCEIGRNIAVFGNSMGECCFNDTILTNYKNCCTSGIPLMMQKGFIKSYLEKNSQIDTVLIVLGEYSCSYSDKKEIEQRKWNMKYYKRFSGYCAFNGHNVFKTCNISEIVCSLLSLDNLNPPYYGYRHLERSNLNSGGQWSIEWWRREHPVNVDSLTFEQSLQEKKMLVSSIKEIIDFCKENQITLVIFNPPTYHITDYLDPHNYYKYLSTLTNVFVADYTELSMPDDYYGDVHHLNHLGATFFSNYIKENGLDIESTQEFYCRKINGAATLNH